MLTSPWLEYLSAHVAVGANEVTIVEHIYGSMEVTFAMGPITALPSAKSRTYTNLDIAAEECASSHVMNDFTFVLSRM